MNSTTGQAHKCCQGAHRAGTNLEHFPEGGRGGEREERGVLQVQGEEGNVLEEERAGAETRDKRQSNSKIRKELVVPECLEH